MDASKIWQEENSTVCGAEIQLFDQYFLSFELVVFNTILPQNFSGLVWSALHFFSLPMTTFLDSAQNNL